MERDLFKSRVRLRHLDCFVCVAQTRNLGRAAAKLSLSQPAVSKTLNELEEIVGAVLLERNRQGAKLTRDGEAFLAHALTVLDALQAAGAAVGPQRIRQREALRIGALPTVAPDLLPGALLRFRQHYPDARVAVQTATNAALLGMLKAGEIDVAVARMADPELLVGLSFELLYVEPLVAAVRPGHPLAGKKGVTLQEVLAYPALVAAQGTIPRHNTESYFASRGLKLPANCTETLSISLARQLTRLSDSVWFAQLGAVRAEIRDGSLAALPLSTDGAEEPVGLAQRSDAGLSAATLALVAALREEAAQRRA
jgi:pca operon transcription factor PcaQ